MIDGRPVAVDLCCCSGGVSRGLQRAGFYVVGVDVKPQPRYAGDLFVRAGAVSFLSGLSSYGVLLPDGQPLRRRDVAAVWASPPCQRWSTQTMRNGTTGNHPDLIVPIRRLLLDFGTPYAIENVPGAPLVEPALICHGAFGCGVDGYRLRRHRSVESNVQLSLPPCSCGADDRPVLDVTGGGDCAKPRTDGAGGRPRKGTAEQARRAMGMPWATKAECNEAVAPVVAELIGKQLRAASLAVCA